MGRLAFYAKNQPHYVAHLAPILRTLDEDIPFFARGRAAAACERFGITPTWPPGRFSQEDTVVVAGYEDYLSSRPARVIFLNHGAGQTYNLDSGERHPAYSGGKNRDRTILFLEPSERAAAISRAAYPDIPAIACGVPYLDRYINYITLYDPELVAISFHTDATVCPETRSAFSHYQEAIVQLARSKRFKLLGHSHPRSEHQMRQFWKSIDVEFEPDWLKVLDRAGVYVCDNSSTLFEFAATDRPVVVLDAPWYRRGVEHGLRFWRAANIGVRVAVPRHLPDAIQEALVDHPGQAGKRLHLIENEVYTGGVLDGRATSRAAKAIQAAQLVQQVI